MRHRTRSRRPLEFHQDGRRLWMSDPDRQELVRVDGLEQHDRLLADHVKADAVNHHLLHLPEYRSWASSLVTGDEHVLRRRPSRRRAVRPERVAMRNLDAAD